MSFLKKCMHWTCYHLHFGVSVGYGKYVAFISSHVREQMTAMGGDRSISRRFKGMLSYFLLLP